MTLIAVLVIAALICAIGSLAGRVPLSVPVLLLCLIEALKTWPLK